MTKHLLQTFTFLGLITMIYTSAHSQAHKDYLTKGERAYEKKDYENALLNFLEVLRADPDNPEVNYKTGISYFQGKEKTKALTHLEKAYNLKSDLFPDLDYHLGMAYQYNYQYAKASKHYGFFKERNKKLSAIANQKIQECMLGDSLMRQHVNVEIQNFGPGVNSHFAESAPLVSSDGETLIFTSNSTSDEFQIKSGTNLEDIYISHKAGATWGRPEKISAVLNTKYNDAAASLSPDGKTLFLYYESGEGDIYTSTFQNESWSNPLPLNKFINHPLYREGSACLSPDGKKLYFTSNRPGGRGGFDIYVSQLDPKGQWGRPSNLGSAINTRGNEESPFMHADGVSFYFSSNGHPNLGDNDIFKSEIKNGKWIRPENLGFPINSSEHDGFFTLSSGKKTGYFSALREGGLGETDLYWIRFLEHKEMPMDANEGIVQGNLEDEDVGIATPDFVDPIVKLRAEKNIITMLRGTIVDVNTSQPLSATVSLVDNKSNRKLAKITSTASGYFELTIPHGGNFGVTTEKPGYLFHSINFDLPEISSYQEVDTEIKLEKIQVGSKVVLKNTFFDVGKSEIKPESLTELKNIRNLLRQHPLLRVQINGHTDNTGHEATNLVLSLKRAASVIEYLVNLGIERNRMEAKGYGSARPLVSNDDESGGRQINRRTEIEIIKIE